MEMSYAILILAAVLIIFVILAAVLSGKTTEKKKSPAENQMGDKKVPSPSAVFDYTSDPVCMAPNGKRAFVSNIYHNGGIGGFYVYEKTNGVWNQTPNDIITSSNFSSLTAYQSVGLACNYDGTVLAVGAPLADTDGVVYIYHLEGTNWVEKQKIASPAVGAPYFGFSVSMTYDGKLLTVGCIDGDKTYIYSNNGTTWNLIQTLDNPDPGTVLFFGLDTCLSPDGHHLYIAGFDPNLIVAHFYRATSYFVYQDSVNAGASGPFGNSLDKSIATTYDGKIMVCGGYDQQVGAINPGRVQIYKVKSDNNLELSQTLYGDIDFGKFGMSIAMSSCGKFIYIGEPEGNTVGQVRIYEFKNGEYKPGKILNPTGYTPTPANVYIGKSLDCDSTGENLIIAAAFDDDSIGAVWFFD